MPNSKFRAPAAQIRDFSGWWFWCTKTVLSISVFLGVFGPRPSEIIAKNQIEKNIYEIWRIFGQIWHFREQDKDDYVHFWWRKLFLGITIVLYSTKIILPARKYTSNPAFNSRKWQSCTVPGQGLTSIFKSDTHLSRTIWTAKVHFRLSRTSDLSVKRLYMR